MKLFQASDCSFLAVTRKSDANADPDCEQLYGTFKIAGKGTFTIENTGECGVNVVVQVTDDKAGHPPYDENVLETDESQLPIEVLRTKNFMC